MGDAGTLLYRVVIWPRGIQLTCSCKGLRGTNTTQDVVSADINVLSEEVDSCLTSIEIQKQGEDGLEGYKVPERVYGKGGYSQSKPFQ